MGGEIQTCALPSVLRKVVRKAPLRIPDIQQLARPQMSEVVHDLLNPRKIRNLHSLVMDNLNTSDDVSPQALIFFHRQSLAATTNGQSSQEDAGHDPHS